MDTQTYRALRAKGVRAKDAYLAARPSEPAVELEWEGHMIGGRATFERDGFTLTVRVVPDEYASPEDWLGTFTDNREPGAVKNPAHGYERHVYEWFVPAYSVEDRRRDLRAVGYSKGAANEEAWQQAKDDAYLAATLEEYVVTVRVTRASVELGRASLGGVGLGDSYDEGQRYVAEVADDLADEAIADARATLARLCEDSRG